MVMSIFEYKKWAESGFPELFDRCGCFVTGGKTPSSTRARALWVGGEPKHIVTLLKALGFDIKIL